MIDVRHLAELAALRLREDEIAPLGRDLERIRAYVSELESIDVGDVEPTLSVAHPGALRADEPRAGLSHIDAISGAAKTEEGGFVVPPFAGT